MRWLVSRGYGFIGGLPLVERQAEEGHAVRIYDQFPRDFWSLPRSADYVAGEFPNHTLVREAIGGGRGGPNELVEVIAEVVGERSTAEYLPARTWDRIRARSSEGMGP